MQNVSPPVPTFVELNGEPLEAGYLYVGAANQNPETNPITVYWDLALSQPAAQPIRTIGGMPSRNGTPAPFFAPSTYSITVRNRAGTMVYNFADSSANSLFFNQPLVGSVVRTVTDKLTESVSVLDFGTNSAAFVAAASAIGFSPATIVVPHGADPSGLPAYVAGADLLWDYPNGGNSCNVLTNAGVRGGLFANYDCKAAKVLVSQINENQSSVSGGGFRDLIFFNAVDSDVTDYTAVGQKVTQAVRAFTQGAHNGTAYQSQYKDLVGVYASACGNIQWSTRGVSGITADAYQYGIGIASNEFAVHNPSAANGGISQSLSLAAIQAIVQSQFADEDVSHISRGVYVSNNGKRITSGIEIISDTTGGWTSQFKYGINMIAATVSGAAIVMPLDAAGASGTIIQYDTNDYTYFDRTNNRYGWAIGGAVSASVTPNGISVGSATTASTFVYIEPGTAAKSQLQLYPGADRTLPNNGEIWFNGTALKICIGGITKTFTVT